MLSMQHIATGHLPMEMVMEFTKFRQLYLAKKRTSSAQTIACSKSSAKAKSQKNYRVSLFETLKAQGLSKQEIAQKLGVHITTINSYVREAKEHHCDISATGAVQRSGKPHHLDPPAD